MRQLPAALVRRGRDNGPERRPRRCSRFRTMRGGQRGSLQCEATIQVKRVYRPDTTWLVQIVIWRAAHFYNVTAAIIGRSAASSGLRPSRQTNNVAEASMRRIALGRSNYLLLRQRRGRPQSRGALHARRALRQKWRQCPRIPNRRAHTVQTHPQSRIQALLPHRWKPPDAAALAARGIPS